MDCFVMKRGNQADEFQASCKQRRASEGLAPDVSGMLFGKQLARAAPGTFCDLDGICVNL
jgi:hypothetical protein